MVTKAGFTYGQELASSTFHLHFFSACIHITIIDNSDSDGAVTEGEDLTSLLKVCIVRM